MRRVLKWTGFTLGSLAVLLLLAAAAVYLISNSHFNKTYNIAAAAVAVPTDSAQLERGHHLSVTRGCVDCHGENLGGKIFADDPAFGRLYASNLTAGAGGIGGTYTDQDWVRAIRHGVRPGGKPLLFMPSQEFYYLSDEDLGALVAYLKRLPAVDNEPVQNVVGPLGRVLYLTGELPLLPVELIDHEAPHPGSPEPGPTAAYGAYVAATCTGCHGHGFSGGKIPGTPPDWPPASNITPDAATGIGSWTEADFFRALREGKRPDGTEISPIMPWRLTAQMTDDEIRATWLYLQTLPPKPEGGR